METIGRSAYCFSDSCCCTLSAHITCCNYRLYLGTLVFQNVHLVMKKLFRFTFIASATGCSFDAMCRYLNLKIFFIYVNDVSLETACPIWKQLVGQLLVSPMVVVVPDLLILQVEFIVFIWVRGFS